MTTSNNVSPDVMRRLHKLLELARRGEAGEKDNAERMLAKTMAKYGVTMEQLSDETKAWYRFTYSNVSERDLLINILCKVLNTNGIQWRRRRAYGLIELTKVQHVEAGMLYDLYRRQWKREQQRLFSAFVNKHRIFGDVAPEPNEDRKPLTPEELARLKAMMRGLDDVHVHKQIGEE